MDSKGVRFLPVVVKLPVSAPTPPTDNTTPFTKKGSESRKDEVQKAEENGSQAAKSLGVAAPLRAVVGVLSRDSVRIAGRLMETERAIRDMPPPSRPTNGKNEE